MDTVGFTKKYSSLSDVKDVNCLAEVTHIEKKGLAVIQHGQCWRNRLACHIKDSVRSFFSPLRKNTLNTAWEQLSHDLDGDTSIQSDRKQLALKKIKRWQKKGVPLRILHIRQLLRQLDKDFGYQALGVPVRSLLVLNPESPDETFIGLPLPDFRLPKDGELVEVIIQDSTYMGTNISRPRSPEQPS